MSHLRMALWPFLNSYNLGRYTYYTWEVDKEYRKMNIHTGERDKERERERKRKREREREKKTGRV